MKIIGNVIGETTHSRVVFTSLEPPRVGEYVLVSYRNGEIEDLALAMVEVSKIGNPLLSVPHIKPDYVAKASALGADMVEYNIGVARILSWVDSLIERGVVETPKYPPKPGTPVYKAESKILEEIFSRNGDGWVRIGVLVNHPEVKVSIDVNAIISRHLAILAVTGAGKSNTVGVLVDRIVNELNGTIVLFDMHNEYGEIAGENTNIVEPKIHPSKIRLGELFKLLNLDEKAHKQRMYLRRAFNEVKKKGIDSKEPEKFLEEIAGTLMGFLNSSEGSSIVSRDKASVLDVISKLEDFRDEYEGRVITVDAPPDITDAIKPGKANIFRLGGVSEEVADVIVYHYLSWLLEERKRYTSTGKGYPVPVLGIIEEAHILLPADRATMAKSIASKIAREGRKFGIGLCLVSQRPKKLDEDSLSQTNNKIILRLIEPGDQSYVQQASEALSDELLELLPSLNVGEAVVLGMMTPLPAIVKIDRASRKIGGGDIKAHFEWKKYAGAAESASKEASRYIIVPVTFD